MPNLEGILFRSLGPSDADDVQRVYDSAMIDGPGFKILGLSSKHTTRLKDIFLPPTLNCGLSVGAFDEATSELVAIWLAKVVRRTDSEEPMFDLNDPATHIMAKAEAACKLLCEGLDLFGAHDEIVKFTGVATLRSYRGRGIATRLFQETKERVIAKGYKVIVVEAGSVPTRKICDKMGFIQLIKKKYSENFYEVEEVNANYLSEEDYDAIYRLEL